MNQKLIGLTQGTKLIRDLTIYVICIFWAAAMDDACMHADLLLLASSHYSENLSHEGYTCMRYGMKINIPILLHVGTFIDDSSTSNHHHQGDLPAFAKCQLQLDLDLDLSRLPCAWGTTTPSSSSTTTTLAWVTAWAIAAAVSCAAWRKLSSSWWCTSA